MSYPWYRVGTISLTNGSPTVVGVGTGWGNPAYVREGDVLFRVAAGVLTLVDEIAAVASNTSLTLRNNYVGSGLSGQSYAIMPGSLARSAVGALSYDISTFTQSLTLLVSGNGVPDNSLGENGWIYIREDVAEYYKKSAGSWGSAVSFAGPQGIAGATYSATSTTSLAIGTGSKTLTTQASKAYVVGARVRVSSSASPTNYMEGIVTAYSGTTLSFTSDKVGGSGTIASWNINIAGDVGSTGATGASFGGTSTTSLAIGTGSKVFTTQAGKAYTAGQRVRASSAADAANYMEGVVASYSGTTLTLTVDRVGGSGTLADWTFNVIGQPGATGPGYAATSVTSRGLGTGAMSFTTQENLAYTIGARVRAAHTADPANYYMEGVVTGYSGTALSVTFDRVVGSGTFNDWTINLAGDVGATGATGPGYGGTSASALAVGTGAKVFTTEAGLAYASSIRARATKSDDPDIWMEGSVDSYSGTTLTLDVDAINGAGTYSDWVLSLVGSQGAAGAAGAQGPNSGLDYQWSDAVADSDQGAGSIWVNNADWTLATIVYVSKTGRNAEDLDAVIASLCGATAAIKAHVRIFPIADRSVYFEADVTGALVDGATYWKLPLSTVVTSSAQPALSDILSLSISRNGSDAQGADDTKRRNAKLNLIYQAKIFAAPRRLIEEWADGFADTAGVNAGSSSGHTVDTTNKRVTRASLAVSGATGTSFGDPASVTQAFDGVTNAAAGALTSNKSVATFCYIGKNYGSSPKTISHVVTHGSNTAGYVSSIAPNVTVALYGKNGTAPANSTDGTLLATGTPFADATNESAGRTLTNTVDPQTAFQYVWVRISHDGAANDMRIAEVIFHEYQVTLVTATQTSDASATIGRALIEFDPVVAITLNTDLTVELTCDNGSNWTLATLENVGTGQAGRTVVETEELALTAGTQFAARVKVGKNAPIYGVHMEVR